jgi:hypothetical protein
MALVNMEISLQVDQVSDCQFLRNNVRIGS